MSDNTTGATPEENAAGIHAAPTGGQHEAAGEGAASGASGAGSLGKDIFSRLADAGEEVIAKVAGLPGTGRALEQAQTALARLDELQKRLLGVEALEKRIAELEMRVAELENRVG